MSERPMTYTERVRVFNLRCKSKEGRGLTAEEQREISEAFKRWPKQYAAMGPEVFEATKPLGAK